MHHSGELRRMNQEPPLHEVISGMLNLCYQAISSGNRVDEKKGIVCIPSLTYPQTEKTETDQLKTAAGDSIRTG